MLAFGRAADQSLPPPLKSGGLPETGIAQAGKPPMKLLRLAILYLVAAGLVALWMRGGFDPVVAK